MAWAAPISPQLPLLLPARALLTELECSICMAMMRDPHLLRHCGHSFCKDCVEECLNRKHICPLCNHDSVAADMVKNHQLARLITVIVDEKEKASKQYLSGLVRAGGQAELTPVEKLFQSHLQRGLGAFQDFHDELKRKATSKQRRIRMEYADSISAASPAEAARLDQECEERVRALEKSLKHSVECLLASYEDHLNSAVQEPRFLPCQVHIVIPSKRVRIEGVRLKPTDSANDLRGIVEAQMQARGDPVDKWGVVRFVVQSVVDASVTVDDADRPLVQYGLVPDSTVVVDGEVLTESDRPKQCFAKVYRKDMPDQKEDYYTCVDCGKNWICEGCCSTCHRGHTTTPYISKHRPTWACCYCRKTGKCLLG